MGYLIFWIIIVFVVPFLIYKLLTVRIYTLDEIEQKRKSK